MMRAFAIVAVFVSCAAWAETPADVERVIAWTPGEYSNRAQAAGKLPDGVTTEQRHLYVSRLNMPQVGAATIYLEWLSNDETGKIASQRVWSFSPAADHIAMRFYTLKPTAKAVLDGVHKTSKADAAAVAKLSLGDLNPYPDNCTFILKRRIMPDGREAYEGMSGVGDCKIYNRSEASDMFPSVTLRFASGEIMEDGVFTYANPKTPGAAVPPREHIVSEFKLIK
jgi:hypothetical protein